MNNDTEQAYGRFEGTVELPEGVTLAAVPTEKKFPWNWVIIGGLAIGLIYCITKK